MSTNPIQIRRRTPLPVMAYAVYLYYSNMSLRYAAKSLRNVIVRSYTSIWRWVQGLGSVLGSFGADPGDVHRIFVDETMVNAGGTSALIWVAFEHALNWLSAFTFMHDFVFENGGLEGMEASAGVEGGGDAPVAERDAPDVAALRGWA